MRININMTLEISKGSLDALRDLASADTTDEARDFVKAEAREYLVEYLEGAGVSVKVVREP